MAFLRKVKAGLVKADVDYFVGEQGNLFFNTETGEIRLSDGVTEGGLAIGGGSGYTLPAASATVRGGVKIGEGLAIDPSGILSTTGGGGGGSPLAVSLIDSANTVSGTILNITALRFDTDSGFDITDLGSGAVKVGMNSTFKTWKVQGQADLVATGLDTIELKAGSGIALATSPTSDPKSLTVSANIASDTQLGVVKQGTNVNIANDGTLSVPTGAGINKIEDIPDVNGTNLSNGDVLVYNAGGQRWDTTQDLFDQNFDAGEY